MIYQAFLFFIIHFTYFSFNRNFLHSSRIIFLVGIYNIYLEKKENIL